MSDWLSKLLPPETPAGQAGAVTCDDELITVGAGAGTGKTWVLSTRFVYLLFSDSVDKSNKKCLPQNILTLTFTEAAAREMQERIHSRAFDMMAAQPTENEPEWQAVKEGFDETWISTIHSFASRLIRESGLSLDLDPYSSVISAPQEEVFWGTLERALECMDLSSLASVYDDKFFSGLARYLENDEIFISALEKWGPAGLRKVARDVVELHASVGHGYSAMLTWAASAERSCAENSNGSEPNDPQVTAAFDAIFELLRPKWDDAWDLWRTIFSEMSCDILDAGNRALKKTGKQEKTRISPAVALAGLTERWLEALTTTAAAPEQTRDPNVRRAFYLDLCANLSGDNSNLFKSIAAYLGQTSSKWRDAQATWAALSDFSVNSHGLPLPAAEQLLRAALLRFSAFAWWAWDEMKRRRSLLSFSDMIRFAAQAVKDDKRPKGFKHVLIDEFQDTDPLQDSMIQALRAKEGAKLFLVGDPKQAIYRFRHADLTLFADYVLQSKTRGSNVDLDVSFRTRASLIRVLNSLFGFIWRDGLGTGRMAGLKFEPLTVPLQPEREDATVPPFTVLLSARKGREAGTARARLAEALAGTLARFVEEGYTVWDKENRRLRPISWRDVAVLTPTRSEYSILEAAFEEKGIPVSFEKSKNYFSRGEVTDVVNVLRAAAFCDDETAMAGWLSSPFSGASQREVLDCLKARASSSFPLCDVLRERLPEVAERLFHLRRIGSMKGPSSLLSSLMEDRTYLAAFGPSQRLRVTGNVNRAISYARQYERDVSPSLAGCAAWLDSALRTDSAAEEPEWMEPDADVVRVMTVHAAKGLEFPVVAVMRMERSPREKPGASVAASKTLGVAFSDVPDMMQDGEEIKPLSMLWERSLSSQSELEESKRLFYVAATRARDSLILCGVPSVMNMGKDSWLSWTADWLTAEEGLDWQGDDWPKSPSLAIVDELLEPPRPLAATPSGGNFPYSEPLELPTSDGVALSNFSATSYALFEWCPFAWRRRHRQGLDLRWEIPEDYPDAGSVGGSELGLVAHWILARWNMKADTLRPWLEGEDVARRMPAVLRDAWRDDRNKEALREWLTAFAASGEGQSLALAARDGALERESAFCSILSGSGPYDGLRLVGAMDVLWRDEGNWHVRDYKITLSDNAPDELYRSQLAFYALVVKTLAERRKLPFDEVDVGLVFLREGGRLDSTRRFISDSRGGDWPAMTDRIMTAARNAAAGPWIPRRENCRRCPWRTQCPKRDGLRK